MEINISNLGTIKEGKLELGKLTILGGKNNSGKTYVAYAIYGFIKFWRESLNGESILERQISNLYENGEVILNMDWLYTDIEKKLSKISERYSKNIFETFNSNKDNFLNLSINFSRASEGFELPFYRRLNVIEDLFLEFTGDDIDNSIKLSLNTENAFRNRKRRKDSNREFHRRIILLIIFRRFTGDSHIITSERTGIQLFQKELDASKNDTLEQLLQKARNDKKFSLTKLLKNQTARYSLPIRDNISQARDLSEAYKQTSFLVEKNPKFELGAERVSGVKFNVGENGRITIASKEGEEKF